MYSNVSTRSVEYSSQTFGLYSTKRAFSRRVHRLGHVVELVVEPARKLVDHDARARATEQAHQVRRKSQPVHRPEVHLDSVVDARPLDLHRDALP